MTRNSSRQPISREQVEKLLQECKDEDLNMGIWAPNTNAAALQALLALDDALRELAYGDWPLAVSEMARVAMLPREAPNE
jgi:hypothetical protein